MADTLTAPPTIPPEVNPMGDDHYNLINEILQSCTNTDLLARGCEHCGLEVGAVKEQNAAQAEICRKLKQVFFPMKI
jgi:sulfur relay (sulfurtransferase) complex TusBCD TusD component (DsrE family)